MIPDSSFFCLCQFPALPENISNLVVTSAIEGVANGKNTQFITRSSITPEQVKAFNSTRQLVLNNKIYKRAYYRRYDTDDQVAIWIRENITPNFSQVGSQIIYDGGAFSPHTDGGPREYILNYLIDPGGTNVETQWFIESGKDLQRPGDALQYPDPSSLKKVKSTCFPKGSWSLLYGKIIHAVAGVDGQRVQLSIALPKEEFKRLKDLYNLDLKYYG